MPRNSAFAFSNIAALRVGPVRDFLFILLVAALTTGAWRAFNTVSDRGVASSAGGRVFSLALAEPHQVTEGEHTLVTILTAHCPFCKESVGAWAEMAGDLEARGIRMIGISLDDEELTARTADDWHIPWPVQSIDRVPGVVDFAVSATPATVLLAPDGEIVRVWWGAVTSARAPSLLESIYAFASEK